MDLERGSPSALGMALCPGSRRCLEPDCEVDSCQQKSVTFDLPASWACGLVLFDMGDVSFLPVVAGHTVPHPYLYTEV